MIEDFYDTSATVKQVTRTEQGMGYKKNWTTRISGLMCRMCPKTVAEADEKGKMTLREVWRLYCAATSTNKAIKENDRVTVNSIDYEVTGIRNPGMQDHHLEINLVQVT